MIGWYDKEGRPIDTLEAARLLDDREYAQIADDTIDGVRISTVWAGLDHLRGDGPPLIFETLVFGGEHDGEGDRYSTEAEALAGHARFVALVHGDVCHDCDGTGEVESHSVGVMAPSPAGRVETCERCEGTGSDLPRFDGEDMHPIGGDR